MGSPKGRESYGDGVPICSHRGNVRPIWRPGKPDHRAKGRRRLNKRNHEVREMQEAEVVLGVLRERGRKGLPLTQLYSQMLHRDLYLLAYANIYSNKGAMTPGASAETAD